MTNAPQLEDLRSSEDQWIVEDSLSGSLSASSRSAVTQSAFIKSDMANPLRFSTVPIQKYRPGNYLTCLSERQLNDCGLKILPHQTDQWLVPIDADDLGEEDIAQAWHGELDARIAELRDIADEEGLAFHAASAEQALGFATNVRALVRPSAFLLGNGNIRLVWQGRDGEQIGLQFLTDGDIQYIFFSRRGDRLAQTLGNDRRDAVLRILTAAGLRHLLRL